MPIAEIRFPRCYAQYRYSDERRYYSFVGCFTLSDETPTIQLKATFTPGPDDMYDDITVGFVLAPLDSYVGYEDCFDVTVSFVVGFIVH